MGAGAGVAVGQRLPRGRVQAVSREERPERWLEGRAGVHQVGRLVQAGTASAGTVDVCLKGRYTWSSTRTGGAPAAFLLSQILSSQRLRPILCSAPGHCRGHCGVLPDPLAGFSVPGWPVDIFCASVCVARGIFPRWQRLQADLERCSHGGQRSHGPPWSRARVERSSSGTNESPWTLPSSAPFIGLGGLRPQDSLTGLSPALTASPPRRWPGFQRGHPHHHPGPILPKALLSTWHCALACTPRAFPRGARGSGERPDQQ
nr:uncharacterized protein LOC128780684 [Desmodus rotundus]